MSGSTGSRTGTVTRDFFRNRTREGWEYFVDKYGGKIYDWCSARGLADADARDVCQAVYVKLWEKWASSRTLWDPAKGSLRAWLRTVARNVSADLFRKYPPAAGQDRETDRPDPGDPVQEIIDAELREIAQERTRQRVSEREWEAYRLRMYEGRSAAETAEHLHLTIGVVNNYTSKVRAVHKEELERLYGPEG